MSKQQQFCVLRRRETKRPLEIFFLFSARCAPKKPKSKSPQEKTRTPQLPALSCLYFDYIPALLVS